MTLSVEDMRQDAETLEARGAFEAAESYHLEILRQAPDTLSSWRFMAVQAARRQDYAASARAIERCLEIDELSAESWRSLGVAHMQLGRWDEAFSAFKQALTLQPEGLTNLLYLGGAAEKIGQKALAADCYSLALEGVPPASLDAPGEGTEPVLASILKGATALLEEHLALLVGSDAHRSDQIKGALWRYYETEAPEWTRQDQRPVRFFLPSLEPKPWFGREEFAWAADFEAAHQTILAEVREVLKTEKAFPYISSHMAEADEWKELADNSDWSALHLFNGGLPNERVVQAFPGTMAALRKLPLCQKGGEPIEVFFSLLAPGATIPPHFGKSNARLTVHLPIIVPESGGPCALTNGGETHQFETGKLAIFDDSFYHEARNEGDSVRVNLVFEVWNPALSVADIEALEKMKERYDAWYAGRGRRMDFLGVSLAEARQAQTLYVLAKPFIETDGAAASRLMRQVLSLNPGHKLAQQQLDRLS